MKSIEPAVVSVNGSTVIIRIPQSFSGHEALKTKSACKRIIIVPPRGMVGLVVGKY